MGKSARDLFSKGFNYGNLKCEMKTMTSSGVNFTTGGSSKLDSGRLAASLEAKFDVKVVAILFFCAFPRFTSVNHFIFLNRSTD